MATRQERHRATGLDATTPVATPAGWRPLGSIEDGDLVFDPEGQPRRVTGVRTTSPVPFWQVTIADGSSVRAAPGQLWPVQIGVGQRRQPQMLSTQQLQVALSSGERVKVAQHRPLQLEQRDDLPLQPSLLGALLADACLTGGGVVLHSREPEIIAAARAALPDGARLSEPIIRSPGSIGHRITGTRRGPGSSPVLEALRELGLAGCRSETKFVPSRYLWASIEQRRDLLAGLLDSDGCAAAGLVTMATASAQMAADVGLLVRSLGGRCTWHVRKNVYYTVKGDPTRRPAQPSHRLAGMRLPDANPFRLARKRDLVTPVLRTPQWAVRSVIPAGIGSGVDLELEGEGTAHLVGAFIPVLGSAQAHALATVA